MLLNHDLAIDIEILQAARSLFLQRSTWLVTLRFVPRTAQAADSVWSAVLDRWRLVFAFIAR